MFHGAEYGPYSVPYCYGRAGPQNGEIFELVLDGVLGPEIYLKSSKIGHVWPENASNFAKHGENFPKGQVHNDIRVPKGFLNIFSCPPAEFQGPLGES